MLSRALFYPINNWLAPCPVIRNPSDFIWLSVKGYHPCWAPGPRALSPPYECVNEWLWVCNIKGFVTSWWFWLLKDGHRSPACTWRTHMQLMSPKRCSSPQNSDFWNVIFLIDSTCISALGQMLIAVSAWQTAQQWCQQRGHADRFRKVTGVTSALFHGKKEK